MLPSSDATGTTTTDVGPSGTTEDSASATGQAGDSTSDGGSSDEAPVGTTIDPTPATDDGSDSSTGQACDPVAPVNCGGTTWVCGNGMDDDGDGLVDLFDPDCISPCDDSEDVFQQSIPGDSIDCRIDCAFDGNSGQGDDGCRNDPQCDPAMPVDASCGYIADDPSCAEIPEVGRECPAFCEPFVPNGCDCFGCCTFMTDEGPVDRLVGGTQVFADPDFTDCSSATPDACPPCTQYMELCGNPCEACELCFGETEPSGACESLACVGGTPCEDRCGCEDGEVCTTGCCTPIPE